MIGTSISEIIQKVSDFGNDIYEKTVGFLGNLPGVACGIATVLFLALAAIGLLSLLKKSFKVFGIIFVVIVALIIITTVIGK